MNSAVKEQWVAALKSGKYKQGDTFLRTHFADTNEDTFCCLGVLCEVLDVRSELSKNSAYSGIVRFGHPFVYGDHSTIVLPGTVSQDVDISSEEQEKLAEMNDAGLSFPHIARWIDINL